MSGWLRKAQTCGLQMVPIPHDPLALPYSNKSDPLRGPIFIPLNTKCLVKKNRSLFEGNYWVNENIILIMINYFNYRIFRL